MTIGKKQLSKKTNPAGLSPAEYALAEYHRIRRAQSAAGRKRWSGKTKQEISEEMRKVARAKHSRAHGRKKANAEAARVLPMAINIPMP